MTVIRGTAIEADLDLGCVKANSNDFPSSELAVLDSVSAFQREVQRRAAVRRGAVRLRRAELRSGLGADLVVRCHNTGVMTD